MKTDRTACYSIHCPDEHFSDFQCVATSVEFESILIANNTSTAADWHCKTPKDTWRLAESLLPGRGIISRPERCFIILTEPAESKPGLWNFELIYGTTGDEHKAVKFDSRSPLAFHFCGPSLRRNVACYRIRFEI